MQHSIIFGCGARLESPQYRRDATRQVLALTFKELFCNFYSSIKALPAALRPERGCDEVTNNARDDAHGSYDVQSTTAAFARTTVIRRPLLVEGVSRVH